MVEKNVTDTTTEIEMERSLFYKLWIKTFALVFVWVSMGMSHAMGSSTVPDMRERLGVNMEEYSRTFAAASIGGMIGAPLGIIGDRFNKKADVILSIWLFIAGIALTLKPWSMYLWVLGVLSFIDGLAWTCVNAIGNSMIMRIWGDEGNTPMHLLHFGYPVGAVISSLIAAVYVSDNSDASNSTDRLTTTIYQRPDIKYESPFDDGSEIEIAYAIVGLIIVLNGFVFLLFQIFHDRISVSQNKITSVSQRSTWKNICSPKLWGSGDSKFGLTIVLLVMGFYFLLVATFKASTTYYVTYSVDSDLGFSNSEAAVYNSVISFAGASGRAVSILAAKFLPIQVMLFIEVYGMVIAKMLMAFWGHKDVLGFWICSVLVLFFRDPIWPSIMTWTDKYIILFAIVVGLSDMASKTSDAIFAWVLGYMYTYLSYESIFYVSVLFGILLCVLLVIMHIFATRHGSRYKKEEGLSLQVGVENVYYAFTEDKIVCSTHL